MDLRNFNRSHVHVTTPRKSTLSWGGTFSISKWVRRRLVSLTVRAGVFAMALFGFAGSALALEPLGDAPEVQRFIDDMVEQHSFARADVSAILADAQVLPEVLEAISRPAERKPWYEYRPIFVTPSRIEGGVAFWRAHRRDLARAEREFGVSPEIIVAIIGVETRYGAHTGRHRVLDALSTLAFHYPKRSRFFRSELESFLLLSREEAYDPRSLKGSYAGAIGLPQFIPSSYRQYAVDFDGDKVRDLVGNPTDAIGSVANYLREHGWEQGGGIAFPARLRAEGARKLTGSGIKPQYALADMQARGVSIGGAAPHEGRGALIELEAREGPEYWVGLQNFYAITRYNHSPLYAMAVHQLAQAIHGQLEDIRDS